MRNLTGISVVLLALALFIAPTQSYAWWGRDHDRGHYHHPDIGFRTSFLPRGFFTVVIGGGRYYYCDGAYYTRVERDYVVVPAPVVTAVRTVPVDTQVMVVDGQETFTLNIPNDNGGYTAVTIKRSGNGFTGPQGEFYSEFPKVAQLKAMYVK